MRIAEFDNVRGQRERFDRVTFAMSNTHLSIRIVTAALVSLAAIAPLGAQQAKPQTGLAAAPPASSPLPTDPKVKVGTLPNGIRYYIRDNQKPEKRAELRLVVNAGSVLENDNQLGLAHFVEHMAFNGTTHFNQERSREVPAVHRCTVRRGPQRLHGLRRDGLYPADSDRHGAHRGAGVHDPRGLGARAAVRLERSHGRARRRARGVAARERRERPHAAPMAADRAERIALRRASTDRQRAEHHDGDAGARPLVLQDMVSPGPSGGDRRRRLRSRGDRGGDQEALRRNPQGGESAEAADDHGTAQQGTADRSRVRQRGPRL